MAVSVMAAQSWKVAPGAIWMPPRSKVLPMTYPITALERGVSTVTAPLPPRLSQVSSRPWLTYEPGSGGWPGEDGAAASLIAIPTASWSTSALPTPNSSPWRAGPLVRIRSTASSKLNAA